MYDRETPSRFTSIRKKKRMRRAKKIGEVKERQGTKGRMEPLLFWRAIVLRNFMLAGAVGERAKSISHKSIYLYPFVPRRRSRAINELTRKPPHVFRNHNSALSNPLLLPSQSTPSPCFNGMWKLGKRDTLELRDIYGSLNERMWNFIIFDGNRDF